MSEVTTAEQIYYRSIKTNGWGNHCYIETTEPTDAILDQTVVWTIKDPSDRSAKLVIDPAKQLRQYGDSKFLLSMKATEALQYPRRHDGEAAVVRTKVQEKEYFVVVADNKFYVQIVCGGKEPEEYEGLEGVPLTARRELEEELGIKVELGDLKAIGSWHFISKNEILGDYSHPATTYAYVVDLPWDKVAFLDPQQKVLNNATGEIVTYSVGEYDFNLHETEFVYFIPALGLDKFDTKIGTKKFDGHHRETLRLLAGLEPNPKSTSYLTGYNIKI